MICAKAENKGFIAGINNVFRQEVLCREIFKELKYLGQGNFSKVFQVRNRVDGLEYAIKRSKHEVTDEGLRRQWLQASTLFQLTTCRSCCKDTGRCETGRQQIPIIDVLLWCFEFVSKGAPV